MKTLLVLYQAHTFPVDLAADEYFSATGCFLQFCLLQTCILPSVSCLPEGCKIACRTTTPTRHLLHNNVIFWLRNVSALRLPTCVPWPSIASLGFDFLLYSWSPVKIYPIKSAFLSSRSLQQLFSQTKAVWGSLLCSCWENTLELAAGELM